MSTILLIIAGLMIAASEGAAIGVLVPLTLWLLLHARQQRQELTALKQAVGELQAKQAAVLPVAPAAVAPMAPVASSPSYGAHRIAEPAAPVMTPTMPVDLPAAAEMDAPVPVRGTTEPTPVTTVEPSPPSPPAMKFDPPPVYDPFAPIRAWLVGGNTIVKLGVAILFIGLAFLARYTADQVAVEVWLAAIAAVAVALLVLGWRLRLRRPGYAQVLQGGAVAILYLTLFAAFRIHEVLPMLPVFVMMVAVAALSAALAVLQDARALALLGALGGFATPLLDGGTLRGADLRARPHMLIFWTTWCGVCKSEMPMYRELAARHPGVRVVAVNADRDGDIAAVRAYRDTHALPFPIALDDGTMTRGFRVRMYPHLVLIDGQGAIRGVYQGRSFARTLDAALTRLGADP